MFVFNRSAAAVLFPLVMLVAVVIWSSVGETPASAPAGAAQSRPASAEKVAQVDKLRDSDS